MRVADFGNDMGHAPEECRRGFELLLGNHRDFLKRLHVSPLVKTESGRLATELFGVSRGQQHLSGGKARKMPSIDDDRRGAIHKPMAAAFDHDLAGLLELIEKVVVARHANFIGCRTGRGGTCADIPPSGGDEDIQSRVIQKADGEPGGLRKLLKKQPQLVDVDQT